MATALSHVEWTIEMEAELITQIERKKYLWDIRDSRYTERTLKKIAYEEIAHKMREKYPLLSDLFTAESLMLKFRDLLAYYRREREKYLADFDFIPKWKHFQRLGFLESTLAAKKDSLDEVDSSGIMEEENAADKRFNELSVNPSRERKMSDSSTDGFLQEVGNYLKKLNKSEESSEEAFGHYIATELKSIDDVSKRELTKQKIQQIIYEMKT